MGVPKFVNWLCESYPSISTIVTESEIPVFDNLYVDMNGIIHNLTHPSGKKGHSGISEKKMFTDICNYLESLLKMVRPRDVFYIAVDGIAPRAKMNQQRERRFGAAQESSQGGSTQQAKIAFDPNCISPGTVFMEKLQEQLELFIAKKKSVDHFWKRTEIILSGHQVPGEGEHKIMDYIRLQRSQPGYNGNTRHCIFGMDADLVFLGLTTHEPNFTVMRQQVNYGKKKKSKSTSGKKRFQLLHLSVLRECINLDFNSRLRNKMTRASFSYNLESIIDDWILLGFFLGNDFLPALPHFKIPKVMPGLITAYVEVLPTLDGYLNENGRLHLSRLETFFGRLKKIDSDLFGIPQSSTESSREHTLNVKKKSHYLTKFQCSNEDGAVLRVLAEEYVRALQWILHYYFTGVVSWAWFYRYHHAPYVSDLKGFGSLDLDFDLGAPLLPFQQLMAILPASSKDLVPVPLQSLMLHGSPILDLYRPNQMNQVLPFIDVNRLVAAMEPHCEHLTEQERARNTHGTVKEYKKVISGPSGSGIMSTSVGCPVKETPAEGTPLMKKQQKRPPPAPTEITPQQPIGDLPQQSPEVSSLQTDGVSPPKPRERSRSSSPTSRDDSTPQSPQASTPSSAKKLRKE